MLPLPHVRFYAGRADGMVVSTSMLIATGDVAGIYWVATLEEQRGRGYGEAVAWAASAGGQRHPCMRGCASRTCSTTTRCSHRSRRRTRLKSPRPRTDRPSVPTLLAMLASSVVAWLLDAAIRGSTGTGVSMVLSTLVGGVAFFWAKRFLLDLRA